jgi:predicted amidohydrolase
VTRLALIGYGNVARALVRLLRKQNARYAFRVTGIHTARHGTAIAARGVPLDPVFGPPAGSIEAFLHAAQADIAVELTTLNPATGEPALSHIRAAFARRMHVVTAKARRSSACRSCSARSISAAKKTPGCSISPSHPRTHPPNRLQPAGRGTGRGDHRVAVREARHRLYHNTAASSTPMALLGIYRKMHIPDDPLYFEKFYFTPGDLGFRAFDTKFGRIAALVCWDQWYPEAARLAR